MLITQERSRAVYILFVLSGMTSLIYQIVWFRMLALVLGNTVTAMSTVLTVFFGGLAIGSYAFGRISDRARKRLLLYGTLEAGIGICALLFPLALRSLDTLYISAYRSMGDGAALNLIRAATSGALLLIPTILMGGTFPLIAKHTIAQMTDVNYRISLLYFLNTAGAVAGSLLAGFLLIQTFGIRLTTFLNAGINFLILLVCWTMQRADREATSLRPQVVDSEIRWTARARFMLAATLFSGFTSLSYEVVWSRALTSYFGSSVYSFSSIVAAFLIGIALGSLYYSRRYSTRGEELHTFGEIQLRIALSVVLFLVLFTKLPAFIVWGLHYMAASFTQYQIMQFLLVLIAMLYTTINLGASFPAANAACIESIEQMGEKIGNVYAFNTIGAILGAFLSGFVLIPWIGMEKTIWLCFFINLMLGLASLRLDRSVDRISLAWAACSILLFAFVPRWSQSLLNYGIYANAYALTGKHQAIDSRQIPETPGTRLLRESSLYPSERPGIAVQPPERTSAEGRIVFFKEGRTSTVSVIEDNQGFRNLLINGKADASNKRQGDMRTQLLLGHLPMILSRQMPSSVLVIGLGSGTTLGSVERYPVRQIDCVEIEPAVVEAANRFFADVNHQALRDPRVRLIIADGRNFIGATDRHYDVITSEPSNLWMAGCSNLFTREFFELAKGHLTDRGILCQWIHLYQISPSDIRIFLKTFGTVFRHVSVWIDDPDMLVLGSEQPIEIRPKQIAARLAVPQLRLELSPSNLGDPDQFLPLYTADTEMVRRFTRGAPLNDDNRPLLEFSAPKSILEVHSRRIIQDLLLGIAY